tara:strand:+ start:366 stop:578 length:213 start_codon:yes stop_codon:yes gene_type:complete
MGEKVHQLNIVGMTCGGCSGRVKSVLESKPGVIHANVSHETNSGTIKTTEDVTAEYLVALVNHTGFAASL